MPQWLRWEGYLLFCPQKKTEEMFPVEMETYALLYNAKKFLKKATAILTISDSLITHEEIDPKAREQKLDEMILLALESIIKK